MFSQGNRGYCKRGNKHSGYLKEGILWSPEYSLTTLQRGSRDSSVGIVTRVQPSRDVKLSLLHSHSVHTGFVVLPTISRRFEQNWRPKSRIASAEPVTVSSKQFQKFLSSKNSPVRYHKASARLRDARFVVQKRSRWSNTLLGPSNKLSLGRRRAKYRATLSVLNYQIAGRESWDCHTYRDLFL